MRREIKGQVISNLWFVWGGVFGLIEAILYGVILANLDQHLLHVPMMVWGSQHMSVLWTNPSGSGALL